MPSYSPLVGKDSFKSTEEIKPSFKLEPIGEDEIVVISSSIKLNEIMRNPDGVEVESRKLPRKSAKKMRQEFAEKGIED